MNKVTRPLSWVNQLTNKEQLLWVIAYAVASLAMLGGLFAWVILTIVLALIWSAGHLAAHLQKLKRRPCSEYQDLDYG